MKRWTTEEVRAQIHGELDRWHGEEYETLKGLLDDLIKAHAHELAEQIREASETHSTDGLDGYIRLGLRAGARLIDPAVEPVIAEGPADAMKLAQAGVPAVAPEPKRRPYSQRVAEVEADTTPCVCEHPRNRHSINGINCRECLCTGFRPEAAGADG